MKKTAIFIVCFISIFFLNPLYVFAESDSLNVKVKVSGGSGADRGDNDISINDCIYISVGYKIGNGDNDPPSKLSDFTFADDEYSVEVDTFDHYSRMYIGIGVNGNPETDTSFTVSFDTDGWYYKPSEEGEREKVEGDTARIYLSENSPIVVENPDSKIISKIGDDNMQITHKAGLQKSKVLAWYSEVDWSFYYPDAGYYEASIIVEIDAT